MSEVEQKKMIFVEEKLSSWLLKIRIMPNTKGYPILKDVVLQLVFDSSKKINMNKMLYPALAENYNISVSQVERRLKTVCEICKRESSESDLSRLFGYSNIDTISVKQVVCSLAERLNMEYRSMMYHNGYSIS